MTQFDFTNKVALVTGGSSGIGKACAYTLAKGGANVIVSDIDANQGNHVVHEIESAGGRARFVKADVSNPKDVEAMVETAVSTYGKLDIAVNNAGIGGEPAMVGDYSLEGWHKVIDVNLNGVFYCMRYEIPKMLENGSGAIINMASILGTVGFATAPAYVAAKHGVVGLTKGAALEYSGQGIRINSVGPGFINTPLLESGLDAETTKVIAGMHPIGRLGEAQEVANLVAFLASDAASFLSGGYYLVDGGYTAQ